MNKFFQATLTILLLVLCTQNSAQINSMPPPFIRDRWDTLIANVDYANSTTYRYQTASIKVGNNIVFIGDSIEPSAAASYFQYYNTTSNTLAAVNYNRLYIDGGTSGGAAITNTSTGTNYVFFGARNSSSTHVETGVYKYNSATNAITSETLALPFNVHYGVMNIGFYSPSTNNDSMTVFVGATLLSNDSVYIYRKHYNQTGFVNTNVKLPIKLDGISKIFTFNGDMYIAGQVTTYDGKLLKSSDGINFTVVSNFETTFPYEYIIDADVMNNKLYLGMRNSNTGYRIVETPDGTNYTSLFNTANTYALSSLECFNNTVWYSTFAYYGNKTANPNANVNSYAFDAPYVAYLDMSTNTEIQSADTLGRSFNAGSSFLLNKINSRLFLSGNYYEPYNYNSPGNFIYEFIPPVANFTISSSSLCLNAPYTFVSQSLNSDSVRWYIDGNFYASTSPNFAHTFTSAGSHTIGLIAISGTQKDSLQYAVNIYSVTVNVNPSIVGCLNNKITITPTVPGAVPPINYSWSVSSALTQTSLTNASIVVSTSISGTYTYVLSVSDANGCNAYGATGNLAINPNKDITGTVDVAAVALTGGNVILYKYEPVLTKFDSVTYQPLNASGTFTFALPDAHTYILKCEPSASTLLITYAPSEISWKTANPIIHGCVNGTTQNINVVPLLNIGTGPGMLTGKVVEGQKYGNKGTAVAPGNPISGLTIKGGKNPGGGIVAQGRTNSAGEYTISNLPTNVAGESYFILVDVPGLDTNNTYHKAITSTSLQINGLDFVVDSAKINPTFVYASVNEININNDVIRIFPNPTNGLLNIQFALDKPQTIEIVLSDITGKEVRSIIPLQQLFNKEVKLQTQLTDLNPGVYLIKLKIGDAERTTRVIITN